MANSTRYERPLGAIVLSACCLIAAGIESAPALAVTARTWSASTEAEFGRGTLAGSAIDEQGRVRLAPARMTLWGPEQGVVWSVAAAGDDAAFVALSGPGRVLRVGPGREPEVWFHATEESLVTALAPDGSGGVYFGLSPEGEIYRARGPEQVERIATTDATFVWSLRTDGDGGLWIGTGLPGRLLHRSASGKIEQWFDSGDDPVRCVEPRPQGGAYLGTGGRGRVVRLIAPGKPFVMLDADEREIVSLVAAPDDSLFALAATSARELSRPTAPRGGAVTETVRVVASPPPNGGNGPDDPAPGERTPPAAGPRRAQGFRSVSGGALYRLDPDGGRRVIWQPADAMPFAMLRAADGRLLVATGDSGRIFAIDAEGLATRVLSIPSEQASALAHGPDGGVLVGGSSDARVEALGADPRPRGHYLTPAIDAGSVADWGRIRWDAELPRGAGVRFEARSGNTAEPDETWHDWVAVGSSGTAGEAPTGVAPARWLQLRVELTARQADSPELRRLEIVYQPRNRAPVVRALAVEAAGVVWVRGPTQSSAQLGPIVVDDPIVRRTAEALNVGRRAVRGIRRAYEAGARTVNWKAEDPDGDRLRYTLEIRREGETHWYPLVLDAEDTYLSWDARNLPDGIYRVRLGAHDGMDNPARAALEHRRVSDAFRIDNTRPSVEDLEVSAAAEGYAVEFVARDPEGSVAAVEVAMDGGEWQPLEPVDGVADSDNERYRWVVDPPPGSTRSLSVRVIDAAGNLGGDIRVLDAD